MDSSTSVYIANDFYLTAWTGVTASNIAVTISNADRTISISGTIDHSDGTWQSRILLKTPNILTLNKTYTFIVKYVLNNVNNVVSMGPSGSFSSIYSNRDSESSVTVAKIDSANQSAMYSIYSTVVGDNVPFDITITKCALYEGEFKNPPIKASLDVCPGNRFLLGIPDSAIRTGEWFALRTANSGLCSKQILCQYVGGYNGHTEYFVASMYLTGHGQYASNRFRKYTIKIMSELFSGSAYCRVKEIIEDTSYSMEVSGRSDYIPTFTITQNIINNTTIYFTINQTNASAYLSQIFIVPEYISAYNSNSALLVPSYMSTSMDAAS